MLDKATWDLIYSLVRSQDRIAEALESISLTLEKMNDHVMVILAILPKTINQRRQYD